MPRRSIEEQRLAVIALEGTAQRAVGAWWNASRFQPELADRIRAELPRLVEALDELAEMVMPKGVTLD